MGLFFLSHRSAVLLCFLFGGDKKGGQDIEPVVVVVGSVVVVVGSVVVVVGSEEGADGLQAFSQNAQTDENAAESLSRTLQEPR